MEENESPEASEVTKLNENVPNKDETTQKMEDTSFKTPGFIIPTKKKIQPNVFRAPNITAPKQKVEDNKEHQEGKGSEKTSGDADIESSATIATSDASVSQPEGSNKLDADPVKKTSQKATSLSPAEQLQLSKNPVPYKEPPWSSVSDDKFTFEILKNGAIIDRVDLYTKAFHVVGRLPSCDIPMEHPSLSRHHAVVQYSDGSTESFPRGWYLYDLDSTHGTWINKNRVPPKKYHRLHVDYVLKFGGSTRLFILQGPDEDREEESELSVSEMKDQREKQKKEVELLRQAEEAEAERKAELLRKREEDKGCSWGFDEDEQEEEEGEENPFAAVENEDLYISDPKKSLNGFFEREGYDPPEYDFTETGFGKWKCSVELPVDTPTGEPMRAEIVVSGKKKEAVVACALEACRMLDRQGLLRKSSQESRKKKKKNWEDDDFYDSDEDVYFDRTGTIEKKREFRKSKVGKSDKKSETYDTLLEKHKQIVAEIEDIEAKLEHAKQQAAAMESEEVDALDAYMSAIKSGMMDTKTKMKLKRQLMELKQEEQKTRKLVNIAKPASLPELAVQKASNIKPGLTSGVGKIKGPVHGTKVQLKPAVVREERKNEQEDFEVEEEDEEEEKEKSENTKSEHESAIKQNIDVQVKSDKPKKKENTTEKSRVSLELDKVISDVDEERKSAQQSAPKVKGPTLPLAAVLEKLQEEVDKEEENKKEKSETSAAKKRKSEGTMEVIKKLKKETEAKNYESSDPDYAVWLPPQNQAGDGKTHLNAKFGY